MKTRDIIDRIAFFRTQKNLSARELSLRIDKHEGYINKLESLDFNLPTSVLLEIIEALEISPEEFFADNYQTFKKDEELLSLIKSLPQSKKDSLITFIKK